MFRRYILPAVASALLALISIQTPIASASVLYTYAGNAFVAGTGFGSFFDVTMNVSGTLELSDALAPNLSDYDVTPLSFSFSDGLAVFTDVSAGSASMTFSTDSEGNIAYWNISLTNPFPDPATFGATRDRLDSQHTPVPFSSIDAGYIEQCLNTGCTSTGIYANGYVAAPGVWSVSAVPVPATVWLFASGALALIGTAGRKKT